MKILLMIMIKLLNYFKNFLILFKNVMKYWNRRLYVVQGMLFFVKVVDMGVFGFIKLQGMRFMMMLEINM